MLYFPTYLYLHNGNNQYTKYQWHYANYNRFYVIKCPLDQDLFYLLLF